ncbi:MAG: succinylglutamate desuccinylase/aspartoacylase family protein, partial [Alcanivoracaceae bacterium]|nr:succinylglutamate desuccinylase/aspartoacylase family protein [Alcanivoracaceae bacterium]
MSGVKPFLLAGTSIAPGKRAVVEMPAAQLYTNTPLNIPVHVVHGKKPGPVLLVCAAIHGDELNGVEIIRRLLQVGSLR